MNTSTDDTTGTATTIEYDPAMVAIIGRRASAELLADLADLIGDDETAVVVSRADLVAALIKEDRR